jgi:hypothetical protein
MDLPKPLQGATASNGPNPGVVRNRQRARNELGERSVVQRYLLVVIFVQRGHQNREQVELRVAGHLRGELIGVLDHRAVSRAASGATTTTTATRALR